MNFICLVKGHSFEDQLQSHSPLRANQTPLCFTCGEILAWDGVKYDLYNNVKGPYVPGEENYLDVYDKSVERIELKEDTIDYESYEDIIRKDWDCCG